jgi:putative phosphoesterase
LSVNIEVKMGESILNRITIGVVSDTHIPKKSRDLPEAVMEGLKGVDLILHAGDINKDYVIYQLEEIAPVQAVAGNTDDDYMCSLLGRKKIIDVGHCRIGLIHGDGEKGTTLERAVKAFEKDGVNCIVFGHSHIPFNEYRNGILCFNPGSPTDKRRQEHYSFGLIHIEERKINGEIIYFQ